MLVTIGAALVVGSALAVAGAVLQSVLRNPLAEPYMLGTVGGGALLVALSAATGLSRLGAFVMPAASLLGSCLSLALVMAVAAFASRARRINGADAAMRSNFSSAVVAGFTVGGVTGSLNMLVLSYCRDEDFASVSRWLYGSLESVTPVGLACAAVALAFALTVLFHFRRELNVMELGRDEAECLGVNTRRVTVISIGAVALATAVSVATAGAVGFVGLVAPHFVRRVFGPRMQVLLPMSAVAGAVFLVVAQVVCWLLPRPSAANGAVGVGVVAAIFGGPFFLMLLASRHNGEGRDI